MADSADSAVTMEQKIKFLRAFTHQLNAKVREKREDTSDHADQEVLNSLEEELNNI